MSLIIIVACHFHTVVREPEKCLFKFDAPEAHQAVAYHADKLYVLGTKKIAVYKTDGTKIRETNTKLGHLRSITVYQNKLFLTNSPELENHIVIFDLDLNYLQTIKTSLPGDLMWIDNYKGDWYGMIGYYGEEQHQTRLVLLSRNWEIEKTWQLPKLVLKRMYPGTSGGGRFLPNGNLYLTGEEKGDIFLLAFIFDRLELIQIKRYPITGNGIDIMIYGGEYLLYGIDNVNSQVVAIRDCYSK